MILGNVICNLHGLNKRLFLREVLINPRKEQVLQMTMPLVTLGKTKVTPAES